MQMWLRDLAWNEDSFHESQPRWSLQNPMQAEWQIFSLMTCKLIKLRYLLHLMHTKVNLMLFLFVHIKWTKYFTLVFKAISWICSSRAFCLPVCSSTDGTTQVTVAGGYRLNAYMPKCSHTRKGWETWDSSVWTREGWGGSHHCL